MKTLVTILTVLISGMSISQLPAIVSGQEGFETWEPGEIGELPQYWDGFNRNVIFGGNVVGTVTCIEKDNSDPFEGMYSVKMTSTSVMGGPAVPGLLTLGDLIVDWNAQDGDIVGGVPYTELPIEFKGQYKYQPVGQDTAFVYIGFMQNGIEVGRGQLDFSSAQTDWTEFTVAINYDQGAAPDSMNILFSTSNSEGMVPQGSTLEIDAIEFSAFLGMEDLNKNTLKGYPNPANNNVQLEFTQVESGVVKLIDNAGVLILEKDFHNQHVELDLEKIAAGVYQVMVETEYGIKSTTLQVK